MRSLRAVCGFALLLAVAASLASADTAKLAVTGAAVHSALPPPRDPFPIRRIFLAESQVEAAVKEHGLGSVVRMPRAEFEARVRRKAEERDMPRLVEAKWTAALDGGDLVGDADWTFANPRSTPAFVSLEPLRIAILAATWADGSAAILGAIGEADTPMLRVPAGRSVLKVKWSAAGGGTDADRQFDLRLLPCSTATLALDLPPDRTPTLSADALVTGPFPSPRDPTWKRWQVRPGERARLELGIRGPTETGGTLVLTNSFAKYDLADARLAGTFEFDLHSVRGTLAEWLFHVPAGLTVTDAIANDRAAWRFDSATRTLRVVLRQATGSAKFAIAASGPLPAAGTSLPAIRAVNAIGSAERVELRVPPGVVLERLDPGDYRLADSVAASDGTRTVSLVGTFASGAARKPPAIRAAFATAEFTTNETLEWKVDSNRIVLAARVEATVRRGPLFRIGFRLPSGLVLDRAASEPENAVAYVSPTGEEIEFAKPLAAGQRVVLNFEFRGPALAKGESRHSFPMFAPLGASERDGRITFAPGSGWSLAALPTGLVGGDAEKGFTYRGQEPSGSLLLSPVAVTAPEPRTPADARPNIAAPGPRQWSFENLHLVTVANPREPQAVFGGTLLTRGDTHLPIELPPDGVVLSATVGGKQAAPSARLPMPQGTGPLRFEVRYRLPASHGPPFRLASPLPTLPGDPPPVARWWAIPTDALAAWPLASRTESGLGPTLSTPLAPGLALHRIDEEELALVPTTHANVAGIAAAVLLAVLAWFGWQLSNRTIGVLLIIALLALGAAFLTGPEAWQRAAFPPLLVALIGAAAIALRRGWNGKAAAILVAMTTSVAVAQSPSEPSVVLLVNDVAIVPQSLLDRLGTSATEPAIVFASASYSGRIDDGLARFTAKYKVHVLNDGEAAFELPLVDARLERVVVDGQPASPLASKADGYVIPLSGRGLRDVEVRFAAPIGATGAEREVRLGIPVAPDSSLDFTTPPTARQLQAVSRNGAERIAKEKDATRIAAALGPVRTLHLRWREGPAGSAATLTLREGCIWDVSDSAHKLTACYQIQVKAGSVPGFRFDLPSNLEPTRVAVRSLDSILVPTVVRDWSIGKESNGVRPLSIDLLAPADGRVLVTLECEPRSLPTRQPVLTLPRPIGMTREFAVYGLRSSGAVVESIGRAGVIDFASDALVREFGSLPDLRLAPSAPITAFSPRAGEVAELRPVLRPSGTPPIATHDSTWSIEKDRATGRGTLSWSGGDAVSLLEFQLAIGMQEVRGPDVAAWNQADGRVQVWLKKPVKDGSLEWSANAATTGTFEVPQPSMLNSRNTSRLVRIRPAAGWGVQVERDASWRAVASEEREQVFQSDGASPPIRARVFPPSTAAARGFAMLEFNGGTFSMRTAAEIAVEPGQPHHFVLQVNGLPAGSAPSLDVPPGTIVRERKAPAGSAAWDLDAPAGAATTFRATLALMLPARGTVTLPAVDLRNGNRTQNADGVVRTLGLIGAPSEMELLGTTPDTDLAALRTRWPGEAERVRRAGGTVHRLDGGRPAIAFAAPVAPAPPIQASAPVALPAPAEPPSARTVWIPATVWCGTAVAVLLLFVRAPRSTWPEQVGLLGALLGFALAGQFVWGVAVYVVARNVWLLRTVLSARK
jgi:hypothetical protein